MGFRQHRRGKPKCIRDRYQTSTMCGCFLHDWIHNAGERDLHRDETLLHRVLRLGSRPECRSGGRDLIFYVTLPVVLLSR